MARGKRVLFFLVGFGWLLSSFSLYAQSTNPFYDPKPLPPTFEYITMDPHSGEVTLFWTPPAKSLNNPDPTGFIIYKQVRTPAGEENFEVLAEVGPRVTSYLDLQANAHKDRVIYKMASKGPAENSRLTDPHGTMVLTVTYDTCADWVYLAWSPYIGWGNRIQEYRIYAGDSPSWSQMVQLDSVKGGVTRYKHKVPQNKTYHYYVEAKRADTTHTSRSNAVSIRTRDMHIPARISIDSLTSGLRYNRIAFKIDETTKVSHYYVARQDHRDDLIGKINREYFTFTEPTTRFVVDSLDGLHTQGRRRFYYIAAVDRCNEEVDRSAMINSIIVRVNNHGTINTITWDTLDVAVNHKAEYRVYRRAYRGEVVDEEEITTLPYGVPLEYRDDVSSFKGKGYEDRFCYFVRAWDVNEKGMRTRISQSHERCSAAEPMVQLPTAIAPLERGFTKGMPRNVFAPLSSYWSYYTLYIYNRAGNLVFTGKNEGWNGTLRDGSFAPEGAYIYRIELQSEEHSPKVFSGSFMVLYPTRN